MLPWSKGWAPVYETVNESSMQVRSLPGAPFHSFGFAEVWDCSRALGSTPGGAAARVIFGY
jgi:hypothetical protein